MLLQLEAEEYKPIRNKAIKPVKTFFLYEIKLWSWSWTIKLFIDYFNKTNIILMPSNEWCEVLILTLKAYWQISKKWCFEKYCSYDKACQFSAQWSYLENLEIEDKFVSKRVRLLYIKRCVSLKRVEKK